MNGYTNNFIDNEGRRNDNDQYTARGDYLINSKSSIMGRFSHTHDTGYLPLTTPGLGYNNEIKAWQGLIGHTLVLGANKVNEFKFSVARLTSANQQPSANKNNYVEQLGIGGIPTNISQYWGVPVYQFGGVRFRRLASVATARSSTTTRYFNGPIISHGHAERTRLSSAPTTGASGSTRLAQWWRAGDSLLTVPIRATRQLSTPPPKTPWRIFYSAPYPHRRAKRGSDRGFPVVFAELLCNGFLEGDAKTDGELWASIRTPTAVHGQIRQHREYRI